MLGRFLQESVHDGPYLPGQTPTVMRNNFVISAIDAALGHFDGLSMPAK